MSNQTAPHILIAGAGPVGLTAALILARAGIRVSVFERDASLPQDLRASTWHPPTLDMLDTIDPSLSAHIIEQGLIARYTNHRDRREGLIASFDMELLRGDTNHPYRVQYEQWRYTRLLVDKLAAYPHVRIVFDAKATGAEQTSDGVTLHYEISTGAERATGNYLIAADGAWSKVRQAVDIEFEGFTFPERFYVASTAFDFASHIEGLSLVNYVSDPDEWCVLLKVPGLWRVLFPTHADEPDEQIVSDTATENRLQGVLARPERYETTHRTLYNVHQRVAKAYRAGRVFLAGDSAHLNNPLGGMG
ncbi:MAG: FAD-dependent monooxygenase, partial [Burkholderiales bacterium]